MSDMFYWGMDSFFNAFLCIFKNRQLVIVSPKKSKKGVFNKSPVIICGGNYEDALAKANDLFLQNNWGSRLAIFPPTKSRVDWILAGVDRKPKETVGGGFGKVAPKGLCPRLVYIGPSALLYLVGQPHS
jgi:hypothetical protein